jgi:hypothetical protein
LLAKEEEGMTLETTETSRLDRRGALRALFGLAVVAAGGAALLAPSQAEAAPAIAPEGLEPEPVSAVETGTDANLPEAEQTQYIYYRRPRRRRVVYYRPVRRRRVVYVRPRRRVYYVRRRRYW